MKSVRSDDGQLNLLLFIHDDGDSLTLYTEKGFTLEQIQICHEMNTHHAFSPRIFAKTPFVLIASTAEGPVCVLLYQPSLLPVCAFRQSIDEPESHSSCVSHAFGQGLKTNRIPCICTLETTKSRSSSSSAARSIKNGITELAKEQETYMYAKTSSIN